MSFRRTVTGLVLSTLASAGWAQKESGASESSIRVYTDGLRVAHVFATTDEGVLRGLGYTQVRDFPVATLVNLWSASGRFAEVAGALVLVRDERMRQWGLDRRAAELANDPGELDPTVRGWLLAYVAGVNQGRRAWLENPERLDALAGEDGATLGFDPVPSWLHPQRVKESPRERLRRLFEAEIELEHVLSHGLTLAAGPDFGGGGYSTFTNVWMMRGSEVDPHTRLLADVHQPLQGYGYRSYLVQLAGPTYDVVGNSVPGFPCIALGANRTLAFSSMTLPKKPRKLAVAGLPFRIEDTTPLAHSAWSAKLETTPPARFRQGEGERELVERSVTLRYWDVDAKRLVDDPRGAMTLRWVRDSGGFELPVIEPGPREPLELSEGPRIRYEARTFFGQRSLWETWLRLGASMRVGGGEGGVDAVFERECLTTGRGQILLTCDTEGGLETLWSSRAPRLGPVALARWVESRGEVVFDGHDPAQRWLGFHGFADLPRQVERRAPGARPEAWIECNSSPHFLADSLAELAFEGPATIWNGERWLNRRQNRARELFERAAEDGALAPEELEAMALDVQDQWSRTSWPWLRELGRSKDVTLSERARSFLDWLEVFRFEGADGKPGEEAFLAHPLSQVTPFLSLLHHRYEDELISEGASAPALALAFDAGLARTEIATFLGDERFAPNRNALAAALEWVSELRERTLAGKSGGLVNRAFLEGLSGRTKDCARLFPEPWSDPLYSSQAEGWGQPAPPVALRWGQMNLYALTPHRWPFEPRFGNARQIDDWLTSILAPCRMEPPLPYYRRQPTAVFPVGGTHDSLFQTHREGFRSYARALLPRGEDWLALVPADFGSQVLFLAELVPGSRPRVRVLPAMGSTEITVSVPGNGAKAGDLFLPTARFARGEWSDLETEESVLREQAGVGVMELE